MGSMRETERRKISFKSWGPRVVAGVEEGEKIATDGEEKGEEGLERRQRC